MILLDYSNYPSVQKEISYALKSRRGWQRGRSIEQNGNPTEKGLRHQYWLQRGRRSQVSECEQHTEAEIGLQLQGNESFIHTPVWKSLPAASGSLDTSVRGIDAPGDQDFHSV